MLKEAVQGCVFRVSHVDEWQKHMVYDIYDPLPVQVHCEGLILLDPYLLARMYLLVPIPIRVL